MLQMALYLRFGENQPEQQQSALLIFLAYLVKTLLLSC